MNRLAGALVALAVLAAGCTRSRSEQIEAQPFLPGLEGHFYAVAGEQDSAADLNLFQFSPIRLSPLSEDSRVTSIGACDTTIVAAAAQRSAGFADKLQRFQDREFRPIDGLGTPAGGLPTLAPDCRLAYLDVDRATEPPTDRLHVFNPADQTNKIVHSAPGLAVPDWGPGGRLAVPERTPSEPGKAPVTTGIVVIEPDGSKKTLEPPAADLGTLQWAASGWMAFSSGQRGTVFLNPDTGERSELAGWLPLVWSPDGQRLLVTAAPGRKDLGLVELPDLTAVRTIGTAKMGVYDLVWLPAEALPHRS